MIQAVSKVVIKLIEYCTGIVAVDMVVLCVLYRNDLWD